MPPTTNPPARNNVYAILMMLSAVGAFAFMDSAMKVLAPHYSGFQVAALRGMASLPILLVWALATVGARALLRVRWPLHLLRGVLGITMLAAFAYGLRWLPLADAYAITFVAPLLITILAVPVLGERVEARRWIAIGVGFVGVLIVLRPTGGSVLTLGGAAVLLAALAYACSAITMRIVGRTDSTQATVVWLMALISIGAGALAWPAWQPIEGEHWVPIAVIAISGAIGQFTITEAFSRGDASLIAPLEYTALAWAIGLDWWLWKTWPDTAMLCGAAIIVVSGIDLIRRERNPTAALVEA